MSTIALIDVDDSVESLLTHTGNGSRAIYITTTVVVIVGAVWLALTNVDVTVRAQAMLVPVVERQTLRSLSEGEVARMRVAAGDRVRVGDTLITLAAEATERALSATLAALDIQQRRSSDLQLMIRADFDEVAAPRIATGLRLQEDRAIATAALVEWKQNSMHVMRAERTRDRQVQLMQRGFASTIDVETADFELTRTREDRALAVERHRSDWMQALTSASQQIADLERDAAVRRSEQSRRFVIAPVSGTIEDLMPLTIGSTVRSGDAMATISPDGALVADVLVSPRDVMYLRPAMKARLLVDGYDVQEWGGVDAIVTSVAKDYTIVDSHPVFRVRVRPLRPELHRANGTRSVLGKGLHCQVRFLVGRKRIGDLLRQRTSELLDPAASNPP